MQLKASLFVGLALFILGTLTLPHYGVNWDTINHLPRGQVYLHYFLTGEKDFSSLPSFFSDWQKDSYWQKEDTLAFAPDIPKEEVPSVSLYQRAGVDFNYFMERDGGHPPLSDILSSGFNLVLFQKLRLFNDIDSYRVYGVLLAATLVGLIYWWVGKVYGSFAGLVAALALSLYPLFWAESHFNTEKDIPETVYWSFLLFSVWKGVVGKSWKWLLLSGVFFGLALGTKFNVLFIPFVILPWLVVVVGHNYLKKRFNLLGSFKKNIKFVYASLTAPLIGIVIFVGSWPYLWPDPIARLGKVVGFYKGIGLTQNVDPQFVGPFGTSTFPLQWILYTTPLVILGLGILGFFAGISRIGREKDKISLLFLLWLAVPVARVVWPGTTVYGGARQIMEYIPPMAVLAGLGGLVLRNWLTVHLKRKTLAGVLIIAAFIPITLKLVEIHPNENVYFNSLIGGLKGAKERDFPFWGLSFGAPYRQGVKWLNENAEEGANVVFAFELIPNIPRIWLRQDLNLHNSNRSGYLRRGEYAITLTHQGTNQRSYYDMYLERFIEPVYKVEVDGVPILKIWKNDDEHLKVDWKEREEKGILLQKKDFGLRFTLGKVRKLSRLELSYDERGCEPLSFAYVQISKDEENWTRLPGALPQDWLIPVLGQQPKDGQFIEPFVGQEAQYIDIVLSPENACLRNVRDFKLYYFD